VRSLLERSSHFSREVFVYGACFEDDECVGIDKMIVELNKKSNKSCELQ